ncbi:MAG: transcription-repair coupling factor [Prevotellaceae bacterium]|jgi:transcription-repair coupling factor (superfamily II helicase)|nr:transcription-repair coupling factor [Prevotellaceae bacterium]
MTIDQLLNRFAKQVGFSILYKSLKNSELQHVELRQLAGSSRSLTASAAATQLGGTHVFVLNDKEEAAYFYNDIYNLLKGQNVLFFPSSYKRSVQYGQEDDSAGVQRTAVLAQLADKSITNLCIVSYPEAMGEMVVSNQGLQKNTLRLKVGENIGIDFIRDALMEYHFERTDFVYEPGQFAIRGSIADIFSFADNKPFRLDFFGDEVESIRRFDLNTQLSSEQMQEVEIVPNLKKLMTANAKEQSSIFNFVQAKKTVLWLGNHALIQEKVELQHKLAVDAQSPAGMISGKDFEHSLQNFSCVHFSKYANSTLSIDFACTPQPVFNKNFDLLAANLKESQEQGLTNLLLSDNSAQIERLESILQNINPEFQKLDGVALALHEGFVDSSSKMCCYTDHQIFARYHRFKLHGELERSEQLTIQELNSLQVGDYVVHIDHGVGVFGGLVKQEVNGKPHEFIKLTYKDGDVLFVSVHGLHRIFRYKGKDGEPPKVYKLGTGTWQKLKQNAKSKAKDIAKDLIALYAKRKSTPGFAFSPDSYLQHELEASFIYEDTPDQAKTTAAVKVDMEASNPMDRLVCGDVGFGKTEVAIRASFKAVTDSKQVAVLVPTTILALQHFKTFTRRLRNLPCKVEYLSRFKSAAEAKKILADLAGGKIDIIIGTHKLLGKDVKFKDLGLLVIDEEQKFGVSSKEKLRQLRLNVDTLTLTATPIPRTLQFSLMGARDLSIIQTPPPNRQPVSTELHTFNEDVIREAIDYEVSRGGQVFFVHNRVQDIQSVEDIIRKLCPTAKTVIAHGQMDGAEMEKRVVEFIMGEHDVLVATSIIENGIDIPNANTIIINQAQNFGLSDLHQLRGRVGRSNRKAFCFLLTPPPTVLTAEARRRLRAIEEFSDLGSGFNIAMQDLDIRGAGNLLGGEQSGFIAEIGFETYQKILNEALMELREEGDLPEVQSSGKTATQNVFGITQGNAYITDCNIETDLELLLPDSYVSNTTEKIRLYREMDNLQDEQAIAQLRERLVDRFGQLPMQAEELLNVVRLRQMAITLGFEKIILKNNILVAYFVSNQMSQYYQTPTFTGVLQRINAKPLQFKVKEQNGKLSFVAQKVSTIAQAMNVLGNLSA